MTITLAENYGFCFGVKRAIDIAEEARGASTYGPLIHNSKEINRLKNDYNVGLEENIKNFKAKDTVVIRTHGIEKDELNYLQSQDINIIDATCPYVTKPQEIVQEMSQKGYDIVIFGDDKHPEIKGVKSYAQGNVYVVLNKEELAELPLKNRIAVVAQTTRKVENYLDLINYMIVKYKEVRVFNTICNATFENQDAARDLAAKSDVMVVIGGKNSSNTKQLLTIAKEYCPDSYLIEGPEELEASWFEDKEACGITAGASTPDWIITQIKEKIASF